MAKQCQASTKRGPRCRNPARAGTRYCGRHARVDVKRGLLTTATAFLGNTIFPGGGGMLAGAIAGHIADRAAVDARETKAVFVSFDYDHDVQLKNLFVGQAANQRSPYNIIDGSLLEAAPEPEWEERAEAAIAEADLVVVLLGSYTYRARGVLKEVKMAKRQGVRCVQLVGRPDRECRKVKGAGRRYEWRWDVLENLLW